MGAADQHIKNLNYCVRCLQAIEGGSMSGSGTAMQNPSLQYLPWDLTFST
ncbi:MAG: hypothetical protein ACO4AI_03920 [Prochlorothrix sp.]